MSCFLISTVCNHVYCHNDKFATVAFFSMYEFSLEQQSLVYLHLLINKMAWKFNQVLKLEHHLLEKGTYWRRSVSTSLV